MSQSPSKKEKGPERPPLAPRELALTNSLPPESMARFSSLEQEGGLVKPSSSSISSEGGGEGEKQQAENGEKDNSSTLESSSSPPDDSASPTLPAPPSEPSTTPVLDDSSPPPVPAAPSGEGAGDGPGEQTKATETTGSSSGETSSAAPTSEGTTTSGSTSAGEERGTGGDGEGGRVKKSSSSRSRGRSKGSKSSKSSPPPLGDSPTPPTPAPPPTTEPDTPQEAPPTPASPPSHQSPSSPGDEPTSSTIASTEAPGGDLATASSDLPPTPPEPIAPPAPAAPTLDDGSGGRPPVPEAPAEVRAAVASGLGSLEGLLTGKGGMDSPTPPLFISPSGSNDNWRLDPKALPRAHADAPFLASGKFGLEGDYLDSPPPYRTAFVGHPHDTFIAWSYPWSAHSTYVFSVVVDESPGLNPTVRVLVRTLDGAYLDTSVALGDVPIVSSGSRALLSTLCGWAGDIQPSALDILLAVYPSSSVTMPTHVRLLDKPYIQQELLDWEEQARPSRFKVGVCLMPRGVPINDEQALLAAENGSPAWESFLNWLGDKVELGMYQGYTGGVTTRSDPRPGAQTLVTQWRGMEFAFHVSTMLPYDDGAASLSEASIARKRHIGNDMAVIVFVDDPLGSYDQATITSKQNHFLIGVRPSPDGDDSKYRYAVSARKTMPPWPPLQPEGSVDKIELRDVLLAKIVNGTRSASKMSTFGSRIMRTRASLMKSWIGDTTYVGDRLTGLGLTDLTTPPGRVSSAGKGGRGSASTTNNDGYTRLE